MITGEERRLVYFYTDGPNGAVLCPACADAANGEDLWAHYSADRLLRCGGCLIWIGPDPDDERGK